MTKPHRLPEKLLRIRQELNLSQTQIAHLVAPKDVFFARSRISQIETGRRDPSFVVLLGYARLAAVQVEVLIDDSLDLPDPLPGRNLLSASPLRRGRPPRS